MADNTKIEWTEATWNPITGCSLASPGCTNCYAMQLAGTRLAHIPSRAGLTQPSKAGPVWTGEVRFNEEFLDQPLRWKRRRMIFVCAHGDLFHESVPDDWIDRIFAVMALCPQHTFQVLTKRSARMREYFSAPMLRQQMRGDHVREINRSGLNPRKGCTPDAMLRPYPLPNVWLGVSVEDQQRADERIPDLLATPAVVRWISAEPLLGPVDLRWIAQPDDERDGVIDALLGCDWIQCDGDDFEPVRPGHEGRKMGRWVVSNEADILANRKLDWVVVGGESGSKARPMHPDWARALRDQCAAADVPFFFKQWGEFAACEVDATGALNPPMPLTEPNLMKWRRWEGQITRPAEPKETINTWFAPGTFAVPLGKKRAGRTLDGVLHDGMPGDGNA